MILTSAKESREGRILKAFGSDVAFETTYENSVIVTYPIWYVKGGDALLQYLSWLPRWCLWSVGGGGCCRDD
ncbi:hypothetical protein CDAR_570291 [Caerostris darwini]|uniref:Uncharacterized protein n=1 Tax=Caerostris darwini TaxID=1538125 RepID=A0AAV4PBA0_9ARAC|nr:hypothetical protein CDAR_570291 [Caerostris darwini]